MQSTLKLSHLPVRQEIKMSDKLPDFIAKLILDCYSKEVTDHRKFLEQIPGHYIVDESYIEKYTDMLAASATESID